MSTRLTKSYVYLVWVDITLLKTANAKTCRKANWKFNHKFLLHKDKDNTASVSLDMPGNPDENKTISDTNYKTTIILAATKYY